MFKKIICVLTFISLPAFAHDGHDHGPDQVPSRKGGIVRALETLNLELVYVDREVRIYPFAKTALDPAKYEVSAAVELPRAKVAKLDLRTVGDHWASTFDPKNAHRFTVIFEIKQGGHKDKVKWTIEPKR